MARQILTVTEALEYIAHQLADIRGEAFAARILAGTALDVILAHASDKQAALQDIERKCLETVRTMKPDAEGDLGLFEEQRATAKKRVEQTIEELRRIHKLRSGQSH